MTNSIQELAGRYYSEFATNGNFKTIPMSADLEFSGPMHNYKDGGKYRTDCATLASNVQEISIRYQFIEGERVHTVYDFDLGLPTGPIPSSETLTFDSGVLVAAELILDSSPLRSGAADS